MNQTRSISTQASILLLTIFISSCTDRTLVRTEGVYPIDIFPKAALSGRVIDKQTHDPLIGAGLVLDKRVETATDSAGFFAFPLTEPGKHTLIVRYVGYDPAASDTVILSAGKITLLSIELKSSTVRIVQ